MADDHCPECGAPLEAGDGKVAPLRSRNSPGPPQVDVIELGNGQVRLRVNLVVPRETAINILGLLGEAD